MAIITIIIICWFVYKIGLVTIFLNLFRIEEYQTAPTEQARQTTADQVEPLTEREKLERAAAYIVGKQGHNPDSVRYMSIDLLEAVIKDYTNEVNKN